MSVSEDLRQELLRLQPLPCDLHDPRWLILPEATKMAAVRRAILFDAYLGIAKPVAADLNAAMQATGLARTRFYTLLRSWKKERRVLLLARHVPGFRIGHDGIRPSRALHPDLEDDTDQH